MPSLDHSSGASGLAELQSTGKKPLVSPEGWARFEAKARNRRIERRLEAARAAIQTQRFADARAAVAELREIDASLPALAELAAQLAVAEQRSAAPRVIGPYIAAAATFAALTLAATWVGREEGGLLPLLRSTPVGSTTSTPVGSTSETTPVADASVPSSPADVPIEPLPNDTAPATSGEVGVPPVFPPAAAVIRPPEATPVAPRVGEPTLPAPAPLPPAVPVRAEATLPAPPVSVGPADAPPPAPPVVPRELQPPPGAIVEQVSEPPLSPPSRPPVETVAASPAPAASLNASAAPPATTAASTPAVDVDESSLVRDVLRRYQTAYDRLDAGLAHAVWPAVNEAALARAFGDLESQSITFNNCDVRLRADTAAAVCTGSARYTPKVGSREPRVEPRVWNFTLRKRASGWLIETARAER